MSSEFQEIKEELDQIRDHLAQKQDRIKPVVWIPLAIWIMTTTISGTWFMSSLDAKMDALQKSVELAAKDRYYGNDAQRDFQLRDQRIDFVQDQINKINEEIEGLNKGKKQ